MGSDYSASLGLRRQHLESLEQELGVVSKALQGSDGVRTYKQLYFDGSKFYALSKDELKENTLPGGATLIKVPREIIKKLGKELLNSKKGQLNLKLGVALTNTLASYDKIRSRTLGGKLQSLLPRDSQKTLSTANQMIEARISQDLENLHKANMSQKEAKSYAKKATGTSSAEKAAKYAERATKAASEAVAASVKVVTDFPDSSASKIAHKFAISALKAATTAETSHAMKVAKAAEKGAQEALAEVKKGGSLETVQSHVRKVVQFSEEAAAAANKLEALDGGKAVQRTRAHAEAAGSAKTTAQMIAIRSDIRTIRAIFINDIKWFIGIREQEQRLAACTPEQLKKWQNDLALRAKLDPIIAKVNEIKQKKEQEGIKGYHPQLDDLDQEHRDLIAALSKQQNITPGLSPGEFITKFVSQLNIGLNLINSIVLSKGKLSDQQASREESLQRLRGYANLSPEEWALLDAEDKSDYGFYKPLTLHQELEALQGVFSIFQNRETASKEQINSLLGYSATVRTVPELMGDISGNFIRAISPGTPHTLFGAVERETVDAAFAKVTPYVDPKNDASKHTLESLKRSFETMSDQIDSLSKVIIKTPDVNGITIYESFGGEKKYNDTYRLTASQDVALERGMVELEKLMKELDAITIALPTANPNDPNKLLMTIKANIKAKYKAAIESAKMIREKGGQNAIS